MSKPVPTLKAPRLSHDTKNGLKALQSRVVFCTCVDMVLHLMQLSFIPFNLLSWFDPSNVKIKLPFKKRLFSDNITNRLEHALTSNSRCVYPEIGTPSSFTRCSFFPFACSNSTTPPRNGKNLWICNYSLYLISTDHDLKPYYSLAWNALTPLFRRLSR